MLDFKRQIQALPCWQGSVDPQPLTGGITNLNYLVEDGGKRFVVRLGEDIPVHHVLRFNEQAASRAAADAGISPGVVHASNGMMVLNYINAPAMDAAGVRAKLEDIVALVKRAHHEVPKHLRGAALIFWVFHVVRDYTAALEKAGYKVDFKSLLSRAEKLEKAVGEIDLVFGHNDLLAGNLIDDGKRIWLIDWDYAGFNSPLFDLGGLAANNEFSAAEETRMLETYYARNVTPELQHKYLAMKAAAMLRETMWSMISEVHSKIDFDYKAYTETNMQRFNAAWGEFTQG